MPCKNAIKQYVEGGYYHIYNRGVDKRSIFETEQDYAVFLQFLKEYLLPLNHPELEVLRELNPKRNPVNCASEIGLLAYCLMPNHFHLLVKQLTQDGLKTFMKALATNYVVYFNSKYDRVGPLFQGIYKAALVQSDSYLLQVSRYIHTNPAGLIAKDARDHPLRGLQSYPYSSYLVYSGQKRCEWVKPDEILAVFSKNLGDRSRLYGDFVNDDVDGNKSADLLGGLILE
ncbi:MAG: hypothetical protein A3K03_11555 [Bdellovibrionales bacterium RIFOXYD1_FULL_44_7]|nr:MAG: hypothetical protein A3K03_11555 [Bdellovibrionales bacterium RIFOXYD1_FULL_44_7]